MIGLVIVTHGRLAEEFVYAMEHVVGPQTGVSPRSASAPRTTWSAAARDILKACEQVDLGAGVILLTDMFGGTPSNLAISVMEQTKAEVIAGLNLPMLIKLASVRARETLERLRRLRPGGGPQIHLRRLLRAGRREVTASADGRNRQRTRPARARLGQVRQASRCLRRRGHGHQGRPDRRRPLDHGPDDAGRRPGLDHRHQSPKAERPMLRWTR